MPLSFFATTPYSLDPDETEIEVFYDYHPAEKRTRDYPGCEESAYVYEIMPRDEVGEISGAAHDAMLDRRGGYFADLCAAALASHASLMDGEREAAADIEFEARREERIFASA